MCGCTTPVSPSIPGWCHAEKSLCNEQGPPPYKGSNARYLRIGSGKCALLLTQVTISGCASPHRPVSPNSDRAHSLTAASEPLHCQSDSHGGNKLVWNSTAPRSSSSTRTPATKPSCWHATSADSCRHAHAQHNATLWTWRGPDCTGSCSAPSLNHYFRATCGGA